MRYFNDLSSYLKGRFGVRVYKVSINPNLGCPNWGRTSCAFCNPESFEVLSEGKDIEGQMEMGIEYVRKRHGANAFIAYFQVGSATYGSLSTLREQWDKAVSFDDVVGLAVSTRPDCVCNDNLKLLADYHKRVGVVWLELGLQSANDETLERISRGHGAACFADAVRCAHGVGLKVCAHVILGLPGEAREDILETAGFLNSLGVWGVKIHNLHIVSGTRLAKEYEAGRIKVLGLNEYAGLAVDFIEHLSPNIIIHRVNAHAPRRLTIAPEWSVNKMGVMNAVMDEFKRRRTRQGARCASFY